MHKVASSVNMHCAAASGEQLHEAAAEVEEQDGRMKMLEEKKAECVRRLSIRGSSKVTPLAWP